MASFVKGPNFRTPFGRNNYLRSTRDVKPTSFTCSAESVPATEIDGFGGQKVLQPGTVMAKITSGPEAGKIGPFNAAATDGRQTAGNIVGLNNTFLPWQLMERDVEIAVVYECTAVQAWCLEYTDDATIVPLTDATADAMRGTKTLDIMFH
jgi:hypothetical protein